jgi:hypothetical protein
MLANLATLLATIALLVPFLLHLVKRKQLNEEDAQLNDIIQFVRLRGLSVIYLAWLALTFLFSNRLTITIPCIALTSSAYLLAFLRFRHAKNCVEEFLQASTILTWTPTVKTLPEILIYKNSPDPEAWPPLTLAVRLPKRLGHLPVSAKSIAESPKTFLRELTSLQNWGKELANSLASNPDFAKSAHLALKNAGASHPMDIVGANEETSLPEAHTAILALLKTPTT